MSAVSGWLRHVGSSGTARAAIFLALIFILWARFQLGGLNSRLIEGYLVLALPLIVAAIGVTLVIIMGQFDLSAAGVVTLVDVLVVTTFKGMNPWLMAVILLAIGAAIGAVNGLLVVYGKLPAIAVTLATLIILQGLSLVLLPQPGGTVPKELVNAVKGHLIVPRALIIIIVIALAWMVFRRMRLGLYMFALGEDEEALHLSGVAIKPVRITLFAAAGGLYALAGILLSISTETGDATIGNSFLLSTFAAVAVGGTAFIGGSGSGVGTLFGALILVAMPKLLFVLQVSNWMAQVVTGVIIILAVLVGAIAARRQLTRQFLSLRPMPLEAPAAAEGAV